MNLAQCGAFNALPGPVCINHAVFTLNGYVTTAGGVFSGPGVYIPVPPSTIYQFDASNAGRGTHTITYITTAPACTLTQNIIVLNYLNITPAGPVYTLASGSSVTLSVEDAAYHSNFRWYENGFLVGSGSSLIVYRMGTFTVFADGPCGPEKAEIEVVCDCSAGNQDYSTGTTFGTRSLSGTAGYHLTTDYTFGGTIIIPRGATVTITNANIDMMPCTKIIIEKGDGTTNGGRLVVGARSRFRGCDKWQGIIVNGDAGYDRGTNWHGSLDMGGDSAFVSDAYIGIYSNSGGEISVHSTTFRNNNTDIALMDYQGFNYAPEIYNDSFVGKWINEDIEDQPCTLDGSYSTFSSSSNRSTSKQMIYLENVKDFNIRNCIFKGNDFLNDLNYITNGIELSEMEHVNLRGVNFMGYFNSGIYGRHVTNVINASPNYVQNSNYIFHAYKFYASTVLNKAIDLDYCDKITLGYVQLTPFDSNQFLGTMNYGVYIKNSTDIYQYENLFNVSAVASTTSLGSNITTALYYMDCSDIDIASNYISTITHGAYFKNCYNSIIQYNILHNLNDAIQYYDNNSTYSKIEGNHFTDNDYGLIISPDVNPIGASTGANNSGFQYTDILCNLFDNNDYAIVGSGDIMDQGNSTNTNGNKFVSNTEWDLIWMDYDASPSWFTYYGTTTTGATPNPLLLLNYPTVNLNGTNITSGNSKFLNSTSTYNNSCFSSLFVSNITNDVKPNSPPILLNTLVNEELRIIQNDQLQGNIICYDALGRNYDLIFNFDNGVYKFNTMYLASGIYFISINNKVLKFYKL